MIDLTINLFILFFFLGLFAGFFDSISGGGGLLTIPCNADGWSSSS